MFASKYITHNMSSDKNIYYLSAFKKKKQNKHKTQMSSFIQYLKETYSLVWIIVYTTVGYNYDEKT